MLDDLIFKYAISNFVKANKNRTGDITLKKIEELKERCVEAKITLINSEKTDITVYDFQGETELNVRINRGDLESEADDIVTMVIELLEKFDADQITKVILSGLTSKQQFIKNLVSSMFDEESIYYEEFGEVALGAAYIAKDGGVEENDSGNKEIIASASSEDLSYHYLGAHPLSVLSSSLVFTQ
jgi:molecular chaperone DnaK (HSP70)